LVDHQTDLTPFTSRQQPAELRQLPVPAELEPLLAGPADVLAAAITTGIGSGAYKWSHRAVLLNTVARVARASLPIVVAALEAGRDRTGTSHLSRGGEPPRSLGESLIELATVRRDMLEELEPHR
jgi:hypothetical protein